MVLLVVVAVMLGSATKLQNERKIKLDGAIQGEISFDGSKNITINTTQNNIAVITGKINLAATEPNSEVITQTTWTIDFPAGFNKDNCVCLSFGGRMHDNRGFCYGTGNEDVIGLAIGDIPKSIVLGHASDTSKIWMQAYNIANSEQVYEYRIVLMKLDENNDFLAGDINGDGKITLDDKNLALDYSAGKGNINLSYKQFKAGDMNKDGIIDARDALRIEKLIEQEG